MEPQNFFPGIETARADHNDLCVRAAEIYACVYRGALEHLFITEKLIIADIAKLDAFLLEIKQCTSLYKNCPHYYYSKDILFMTKYCELVKVVLNSMLADNKAEIVANQKILKLFEIN